MPEELRMPLYVVLIVVVVSIALCTLHLCLGFWIGQKRVQRRVRRTTKLASDAIMLAAQELNAQRTAAEKLNDQADQLMQTLNNSQVSVSPLVLAAIERLAGSSAALRERLQSVQSAFATRVEQLQTKQPNQPKATAAPTKPTSQTGIGILAAEFQTAIEAESRLASQRLPARKTSTAETPDAIVMQQIAATGRPREQRTTSFRYPYEAVEYFAPFEGELPTPESFNIVQCCDLSGDSISYFVEHRPDYETIVISVGRTVHELFVVAKVDTVRAACKYGAAGYVVQCQFLKRLDNHYRWDAATDSIVAAEAAQFDPVLADLGA
jgi:hypothetical protein